MGLYKQASQFGMGQTDKDAGVRLPAGGTTPIIMAQSEDGVLLAYGTSVPSSAAGYAPGCVFIDVSGAKTYSNTGSVTTSTFTSYI